MRVEVEELVALVPDEVVAAARAAAGDPDGLRQFERLLERGVVDRRDAVDAQPDAEDDEGRLEVGVVGGVLGCGGEEGVEVDVAVVWAGVDAEVGGVGAVCEGSKGRSKSVSWWCSSDHGQILVRVGWLTVYTSLQRWARTIRPDACHKPARHAQPSCGY